MKTKFVVVGRADCPWCKEATDLLSKQAIPFEYWDITHKQDRLRGFIKSLGLNTVPQVWLGSELIGGYQDLKTYLRTNDSVLGDPADAQLNWLLDL